MKITTWNVNGLRAAYRNQANSWWEETKPEILCLQEIRSRPDQLTQSQLEKIGEQEVFWHPAERPGYSGVAALCREKPLTHQIGMGFPHFDREGRIIQLDYPSFTIFNLYVPNGQRDLARLDFKLDFYRSLLEKCNQLHQTGQKLILCGDFNTAHRPIDLRNPKANEANTGFLPEERAWIDRFLEDGFVDIFRELHPEKEEYTWWTYRANARSRNIGWRLDYFLISDLLIPEVIDVVQHTDVLGSDHCPVTLEIST